MFDIFNYNHMWRNNHYKLYGQKIIFLLNSTMLVQCYMCMLLLLICMYYYHFATKNMDEVKL